MDPSDNLNVITGETGAGKSIMLGALGLLMGNRADMKVLWDENEKCIIEASYNIKAYGLEAFFKENDLDYDDLTVIRREISPGGKSRAFINDTPVTLETLRLLGNQLMDIHSQHETLQLGAQSYQLNLLDVFAGNQASREAYQNNWREFLEARNALEKLKSEAGALREEADYIKFQLDELNKASLVAGEQEKLESELKVIEHSEEIKLRFNSALEMISHSDFNAQSLLANIRQELSAIAAYSPDYESLLQRVEAMKIELEDVSDEIEKREALIEFDPERTELVKEKLSNLYRLQKKHRVNTIADLILIRDNLAAKNLLTSNLDEALANAEDRYQKATKKLAVAAAGLSETRRKQTGSISQEINALLKSLGIPNATIEIDLKTIEPGANGIDKVDVLFSANKGIAPRPLSQVASGGEFSRLMFAIKYVLATKSAMPTLILDEIDNGVSGEIAIRLGSMMQAMSKKHQLITISHLPQIAAKGDRHYFVYKDNSQEKTVSRVKLLSQNERVEEIAKMIGGEKPTKVALDNAQELLSM